LDDLSVTRTLEAWVEHRRLQRLAREAANAGAVALGCGAVALSGWLWVPELLFVPPLFGLGALVAVGVGVWRARSRFDLEALADEIDAESGSDGLMRTALAVEGRRAVGSDALQAMVRGRAVEVLPHLEAYGRPPFEVPAVAILGGALALLLAVLAVALAIVLPALVDANAPTALPVVPVVLHDGDRSDLIVAIEDLARLAREPGAEPEARAEVDKARGHVQEALSHLSDARRAAAELDVARAALERAQRGSFRSAAALEAARSEAVADALADALQRGDAGIARRMADEILRRIESERSEGELRRLGRSLADRPRPPGAAGLAMERAGEKLGAGDQGGALAALADLMAALGEPVRVPDRPAELQQAAEAIERARQRALARLDQAEREASGEPAGRSEGAPEPVGAPPSAPGDGEVLAREQEGVRQRSPARVAHDAAQLVRDPPDPDDDPVRSERTGPGDHERRPPGRRPVRAGGRVTWCEPGDDAEREHQPRRGSTDLVRREADLDRPDPHRVRSGDEPQLREGETDGEDLALRHALASRLRDVGEVPTARDEQRAGDEVDVGIAERPPP
jgi:hypothetical protein